MKNEKQENQLNEPSYTPATADAETPTLTDLPVSAKQSAEVHGGLTLIYLLGPNGEMLTYPGNK